MHAWKSIQKSIEYIETHTTDEISIETLADIANLSPYYYQRLFKRLVKKSVFEYTRLRRLAQSAQALKNTDRIIDVAIEYGFSSHANFTRSFKEAFGITPDEYRVKQIPLNQMNRPDLQLNYVLIDEDVPLIADGIVIEITRKHIVRPELYHGLTTKVSISEQIPVGEATGVDTPFLLWDRFHSIKSTIDGLVQDGVEIGVSMMEDMVNGEFTYFAGAAVSDEALINIDLTAWELPVGEYIVCSLDAESYTELVSSALGKAMNYLFGIWLPKHKLSSQPFSVEKYFSTNTDDACMEIWVTPIALENTDI